MELSAYIHLNPVRAALEEDPLDYPWSSYKVYASGAADDLVDQRALLAHFSKNRLRARKEMVRYMEARIGQRKREEFYRAKDQRFLGSEDFVDEVKERLGEGRVFSYHLSIPEIVGGVVSSLGIGKESICSENRNREGSFGRGDRWILGEAFERAFFEIGSRAYEKGSGSHQPGVGVTGIEVAERRYFEG